MDTFNIKKIIILFAILFSFFSVKEVFASGEIYYEDWGDYTVLAGGIVELSWVPLINSDVGSFDFAGRYFHTFNGSETMQIELWEYNAGFTTQLDCNSASQSISSFGLNAYNVGPTEVISVAMSGSQCSVSTGTTYRFRPKINGSYTDNNLIYGYCNTGCVTVSEMGMRINFGTPPDTSTRFISVEPTSGDTVATTTDISWNVYINPDEYTEGSYVRAYFYQDAMRSCQNSGAVYDAIFGDCPTLGDPFTLHFDDVLDRLLAGNNSTTTSYTFPQGGKWRGEYSVRVPHLFGLYYTEQIATTTLFTIGQKSTIDITRETIEAMDRQSAFSDIYASSTAQIGSTCNPLSGSFSMGDCLLDVIYDPVGFSDNLLILRQTPPWGYAFRMYDIFSTTTVGSLPIINATLPMLGNPNITVDLTNSLDFILDATTSQFANVSASSTQTFFQITNFYWSLILYVGAGFYVLSRILGTRLIPKLL